MARQGIASSDITDAILSSVVPDANFTVKSFVRHYLHCEPLLISSGQVDVGMPVLLDNPKELGADRLINAFAAWDQWKQPLIVIDFGTATTFDIVGADGSFEGGIIAPGINLSLEALVEFVCWFCDVAIDQIQ